MEIIYDILLQVGKIFFLFLILISLGVSALILFRPQQAANASTKFNQWISTDAVQNKVDDHYQTDEWVIRNRWWIGGIFLVGALLTLKFVLMDFEEEKFINLVINPVGSTSLVFFEIIVGVTKWIIAVTSFIGIIVCAMVLVKPGIFKQMSAHLDRVFSTRKVQEAVDVSHMGLDRWVLEHHIMVGLFLFLGSCFIIVFCVTVLL